MKRDSSLDWSLYTFIIEYLLLHAQARASEIPDGLEEGYESSRDEISSVSSYNPARGNIDLTFRNSLSLQSPARRSSSQDFSNIQGEYSGAPSYMMLPQLSMAEALQDPTRGTCIWQCAASSKSKIHSLPWYLPMVLFNRTSNTAVI